MRTILNIDIALLGSPPAAAPVAERPPVQAAPRLFQMGEAPPGAPTGWGRWGKALGVAVAVHGALLTGALALNVAAPRAVEQDAPELVLFAYAPPPPSAAAGSALAVARPARPVQARVAPRPVVPKQRAVAPVRAPAPTPVAPEPEVVAQQQVPVTPVLASVGAGAVGTGSGGAPGGMAGGVAGGVVGGHVGGIAGAPVLSLKQVARLPQLLEQVRPRYPRSARSQGIVGVVLVRAILGVDGRVEEKTLQVLRSIPALDEAAVEAVRRWRFSPAIGREGRPVRVMFDVPVQFSLR